MSERETVVVERRPIFQGNPISVGGILKLLALLALIAAFCVAEGWLTKGTWQEWIAGGLALWCASEIV